MVALSKDEVPILIKVLVGDQWAFVFSKRRIAIGSVHLNLAFRLSIFMTDKNTEADWAQIKTSNKTSHP